MFFVSFFDFDAFWIGEFELSSGTIGAQYAFYCSMFGMGIRSFCSGWAYSSDIPSKAFFPSLVQQRVNAPTDSPLPLKLAAALMAMESMPIYSRSLHLGCFLLNFTCKDYLKKSDPPY